MQKLYACLASGNCFKPWLALHQLGQEFDLEMIDVLAGEQKSERYLAINPNGVVPFFETASGLGLGESNAIVWYLCEGTHLMPADKEERAEALQWMLFEQSKLEPFISPARFFTTILPGEKESRADDIAQWQMNAAKGLARLDEHLSDRTFMLKSGYSVADIAMFGYVHVMDEADIPSSDYPSVARWMKAVQATEGFRPLVELGADQTKAA